MLRQSRVLIGVLAAVAAATGFRRVSAESSGQAQGAPAAPRKAGELREDSLWSQSLGIRKRFLVWLPPSYAAGRGRRYPVAYYLHGAFGDETNWTKLATLHLTLDSLVAAGMPEMIVVMPDGDDGFYTTWNWLGDVTACRRNRPAGGEPSERYCVPWPHYDDYVARDLVAHVDRRYRTMATRRNRGIAGLSMGGYGAISLALSYPDVFAAAASHSGALAPLAHGTLADTLFYATSLDALRVAWGPRLWAILEPAFGKDTTAWLARDPARKAERLTRERKTQLPALFADCGTEDFLLGENRFFRRRMTQLGVPLEYAEWPGGHTWDYWRHHSAESVRWLALRLNMR